MAPPSESGSDSDNDAPEEVSVVSAKKGRKNEQKAQLEHLQKTAEVQKARNRARNAKGKAVKGKAKAAAPADEGSAPAEDEDEDEVTGDLSSVVDDESEANPPPPASSSLHLDPSLFASAASFYAPPKQPAAGQGKGAMKKLVKEEKRFKAAQAAERAAEIKEGGARSVGALTLQHLPSPSHLPPSLTSSTPLPPTSASKFLSARLYSKKRAVAVLDAGNPAPRAQAEDGGRKRAKKGKGKGMSEESRILLGMGMDDGSKATAAAEGAGVARKRTLLLQAEGKRMGATLARPLRSARASARPAQNFAVATRTR